MFGDTNSVLARLGVPTTDSAVAAIATVALNAATDRILARARFSEAAITGQVETLRSVQLGRDLSLAKRPVSAITSIFGRLPGQDDHTYDTPLTPDLYDAYEGRLLIVVTAYTPIFPPHWTMNPNPHFQWRAPRWPIVTITYDVDAIPAEDKTRLSRAANELAIYWMTANPGVTGKTVGPLATAWVDDPKAAPPWFEGMLRSYVVGEMGSSWIG